MKDVFPLGRLRENHKYKEWGCYAGSLGTTSIFQPSGMTTPALSDKKKQRILPVLLISLVATQNIDTLGLICTFSHRGVPVV